MPQIDPTTDKVLARADALERTAKALRAEVGRLRSEGRRNRNMIRALIAVAVATVIALIVCFVAVAKADDAVDKAEATARYQQASCEAANDSRALQRRLWGYLFSIEPDEPRTATEERQIVQFRAFVDKTFADRDCAAAGRNVVR